MSLAALGQCLVVARVTPPVLVPGVSTLPVPRQTIRNLAREGDDGPTRGHLDISISKYEGGQRSESLPRLSLTFSLFLNSRHSHFI